MEELCQVKHLEVLGFLKNENSLESEFKQWHLVGITWAIEKEKRQMYIPI